jgi:hypothetical protein
VRTELERTLAAPLRDFVELGRPTGTTCPYCGPVRDGEHKRDCIWARGKAAIAEFDSQSDEEQ